MSKSIIKQKRILTKAGGGSSISTPVSVANGGTGLASYAIGDIIYASGATTLSKLAIGTASQQLRVNAGATALEYFTPTGSGITVGTTTITSGTTGSIGMNIGGIYTESISYRAQQATPFSTAFGFESHSSGSFSGVGNTSFGYQAGKAITTATRNTFIGYRAGTSASNTLINDNVCIGYNSGSSLDPNADCSRNVMIGSYAGERYWWKDAVFIGYNRGRNSGVQGNYNILIGSAPNNGSTYSDGVYASTIAIGYDCFNTTTHQGVLGSNNANGYISNWYFNGVTHTAAYSVNLRGSGGSGSNNVAANLNFYAGLSTGSGTPATVGFYSSAAEASSSTAQTAVKVFEITNSTTITTTDAVNYALGSTTGTKWGTATTQKQAFWNATPIVQPTTAYAAATLVGGAGTNITDTDTFDGYTLKQIVAALRGIGLLA